MRTCPRWLCALDQRRAGTSPPSLPVSLSFLPEKPITLAIEARVYGEIETSISSFGRYHLEEDEVPVQCKSVLIARRLREFLRPSLSRPPRRLQGRDR